MKLFIFLCDGFEPSMLLNIFSGKVLPETGRLDIIGEHCAHGQDYEKRRHSH
jgi:hypothetical protein